MLLDIHDANPSFGVLVCHLFEEVPGIVTDFGLRAENLPECLFVSCTQAAEVGVPLVSRAEWRTFCQHQEESDACRENVCFRTIIVVVIIKHLSGIVRFTRS